MTLESEYVCTTYIVYPLDHCAIYELNVYFTFLKEYPFDHCALHSSSHFLTSSIHENEVVDRKLTSKVIIWTDSMHL